MAESTLMVEGTAAGKYASQLLKAGDAAILLPQAVRCKGPLDRLLTVRYTCFVPGVANEIVNPLATRHKKR